ncbi:MULTISPECIES: hypothetical protein [unclassified Rhizobium]|uniref:hypothetical protein n=1 Tax=unclassified Rhizobium TaxID=2613769 RepID=UPI00161544EB|nr:MULTISPECIES: hypothetical protein [unclassified Rhizobium]MBB3297892.1 hypothetical protein [Rhizobium sp. BK112]MBB4177613.1 hypothetical protein [Rhizobium sp. BK109]
MTALPDALVGSASIQADPQLQIRLDRARSRSLMICTPIARNPAWEYTASICSTLLFLRDQGINCTFQFVVGSSVVHKARNELVAHFLASPYTDMLFIDDDMQWSPNDVLRLLASDKPLIGGVGRMRVQKPNSDPAVWCWRPIMGAAGYAIQDEMGAVEVLGFGAAFMMINKVVFDRMITEHPEWKKSGPDDWAPEIRQHYFEFFRQNHEGEPGEVSEDYVFCDRWRRLGEHVWVDPTISLGHIGSWNFRGSVSETMSQAEQ